MNDSALRKRGMACSGFSLVEVMVAMGAASVLSLAIASMIMNQSKATRNLANYSDFKSLESLITAQLSSGSCNQMFNGTKFPAPGKAVEIALTGPFAGIQQNGYYGQVPVNSVTLQNNGPTSGGGFQAALTIKVGQVSGASQANVPGGASAIRTATIPFIVNTTGASISSCNVATAASACQQMGGNWNTTSNSCAMDPKAQCMALGGVMSATAGTCQIANSQTDCTQFGGSWNPSATPPCNVLPTNQSQCGSLGGTWSGSSCTFGSASSICSSLGGTMTGGACKLASSSSECSDIGGTWTAPNGPCSLSNNQQICQNSGGTWTGASVGSGKCAYPGDPSGMCAQLGGTWNAAAPNPSTGGTGACALGGASSGPTVSAGPNGYADFGSFKIQWMTGSYSKSAYNEAVNYLSFPAPFKGTPWSVHISTQTTGTDDGEAALFTVTSVSPYGVWFFNARNADHGGNPNAPVVIAIGQ